MSAEPATDSPIGHMKKVRLYVRNDLPNSETVLNHVRTELSTLFGGATEIPNCRGGWISPDTGKYHDDGMTLVESLTDTPNDEALIDLAQETKDRLGEEAVLLEITDSTAAFI